MAVLYVEDWELALGKWGGVWVSGCSRDEEAMEFEHFAIISSKLKIFLTPSV